jgi:hypothetical protein
VLFFGWFEEGVKIVISEVIGKLKEVELVT